MWKFKNPRLIVHSDGYEIELIEGDSWHSMVQISPRVSGVKPHIQAKLIREGIHFAQSIALTDSPLARESGSGLVKEQKQPKKSNRPILSLRRRHRRDS